jgi:hypothetical protein
LEQAKLLILKFCSECRHRAWTYGIDNVKVFEEESASRAVEATIGSITLDLAVFGI